MLPRPEISSVEVGEAAGVEPPAAAPARRTAVVWPVVLVLVQRSECHPVVNSVENKIRFELGSTSRSLTRKF